MKNFFDKLIDSIESKNSHVVVGLDPRIHDIPRHILEDNQKKLGLNAKGAASALLDFGKKIIDAVHPHAPAVKIQIAYYEYLGYWGIWAFQETAKYARQRELLVIGDVKRADISSTAQAYAEAYFQNGKTVAGSLLQSPEDASYFLDAVTLNPYFGSDSLEPFITLAHKEGKGLFILVKTSNPSSEELQDLQTANGLIYEIMAKRVHRWGEKSRGLRGYSTVGAVAGATFPKAAERLRELMPNAYFLVPGYGAQGAKADSLSPFFNHDGFGAIVNSSRGIIFAYKQDPYCHIYGEEDFPQAASAATIKMKEEINSVITEKRNRDSGN